MRKIFLLLVLAGLIVFYMQNADKINSGVFGPQMEGNAEKLPDYRPVVLNSAVEIDIPVNMPVCLNYKTKQEVYALRKQAVEKSIFRNPDYKPSYAAFGQIEDGKPWISMNKCMIDRKHADIFGASEEARFILNPSVLVAPMHEFYLYCNNNEKKLELMPVSVKYSEPRKEITVIYSFLETDTLDNHMHYTLNGLNARDFGYKYAYIDKNKTNYDLIFLNEPNISTQVIEFHNYIHTGGSCRIPGGCNNGSPNQPMLYFENSHKTGAPYKPYRQIYIKLWKKMPKSPEDEADINERIIIENA